MLSGYVNDIAGYLRSRRDKKYARTSQNGEAQQDGKEDKSESEDEEEGKMSDTTGAAEIDEDGFTIMHSKPTWEYDKCSFYSSSDSDSDKEPEKKFHVEIKPLSSGSTSFSASVNELRSTVENLTLTPVSFNHGRKELREAKMKRSQSVSQQIGSTDSSPTTKHPKIPLNQPKKIASRYEGLGDIFAQAISDNQPSLFSSISSPEHGERHTLKLKDNPQPNTLFMLSDQSKPTTINNLRSLSMESESNLVRPCGPSNFPIGISDSIPLAVAFHEIIHAHFKDNDENKCAVKLSGDMMISFPAGIISLISSNCFPAQLSFKVRSKQALNNLIVNKDIVKLHVQKDELQFEFKMSDLIIHLKNHSQQNPCASYFNVEILKYHIKPKVGVMSCPIHLVAYWRCESNKTDLRIDYKYNSHALEKEYKLYHNAVEKSSKETGSEAELLHVYIAAPVNGGVKTMQSKPTGQWIQNTNRMCWKFPSLSSKTENRGIGSLRARFELTNPCSQGTIAAQFSCDSSTLSGCNFELLSSGYRVSLIKKRFVSGKYICDALDVSNSFH